LNSPERIPDYTLREHLPYAGLLLPEEFELLQKKSTTADFSRKDIIFRQGSMTSHIMLMISGLVKIFKEGRRERTVLLRIARSGEYLGILSVMGEQIHQYSAAALEPCKVNFIDINAFRNVLMKNGKFSLQLMNLISRDGLFIFNRLVNQTQKQLPGRIADVLLYFAEDIYQKEAFQFPLSRRELAELAGTTKESFIRTLTEFKNDKIISLEGTRVTINSMDLVRTLSELG
jgi:CRP-like cAMP-binding protein